MKGKALGGKMNLGLHWQVLCLVNKSKMQPKFSCLISTSWKDSIWKEMDTKEVWETPRTLLGTLEIVFHWCQRQLQISHVQPEVFIQEPRNFGFDKKPQVGVNISLATFCDIYTLCGSSWSDDCEVFCRHLLPSHPHLSLQVEKQLQGRESD